MASLHEYFSNNDAAVPECHLSILGTSLLVPWRVSRSRISLFQSPASFELSTPTHGLCKVGGVLEVHAAEHPPQPQRQQPLQPGQPAALVRHLSRL